MSGIAGIWYLDGQLAASERIRCMTDAIAHRGPDGVGHWVEGPVGLGHVMFRTVPEAEGETQPLVSEDGQVVLVMDGRVDNREEMICALGLPAAFLRRPDSALVLSGYRRWGADVLKRMLGDYALAIWDAREQRLLLARDHFGVRPLFFTHQPGQYFAFASEIKSFRAADLMIGEPNEVKIADLLHIPVEVDPADTYWKNIRSLRPAHFLWVDKDRASAQKEYWALDPTFETRLPSDKDYIEQFRELFEEAIRCRARSNHDIGSMMSGGLDSTSIACSLACQMRAKGGGQLYTLSATFDSVPESNEREYMESSLNMYREWMTPIILEADRVSPLAYKDQITWYLDRPDDGFNNYLSFGLYQRFAEEGGRVVLEGYDGDTTVSHGIAYYYELLWSLRWVRLYSEVKSAVELVNEDKATVRRVYRGWIKHYVRRQPLLASLLHLHHRIRGRDIARTPINELAYERDTGKWKGDKWQRFFNPQFIDSISPYLIERSNSSHPRTEREHHYFRLARPVMEHSLQLFNAMAAASGVEVRFPFYDLRLVEYCLSLPGKFKLRNGWSRWILRQAMDGILPRKIQWRVGKSNLGPSFSTGLRRFEIDRVRKFGKTFSRSGISQYMSNALTDDALNFMSGDSSNYKSDQEAKQALIIKAMMVDLWLSMI